MFPELAHAVKIRAAVLKGMEAKDLAERALGIARLAIFGPANERY
jgi:hypothetical protein